MTIELTLKPVREFFYSDDSDYGIYACETDEKQKVMLNRKFNTFSLKGKTVRLRIGEEYKAVVEEKKDNYGVYYEIQSLFEEVPTDTHKQKTYLKCVLTDRQVEEIYKTYPNQDIIQLIREDKLDYEKVKHLGKKSYLKIKDRIIENLEFQGAFEFLSGYGVTNNTIIKLVKHFNSASLLIKKMKVNPYSITEVSGIGFKKADAIAMNMGYDPKGKFRIITAIEHVVEEEGNKGHTYVTVENVINLVEELTMIEPNLISQHIVDTDNIVVVGEKVALIKNYRAEQYISNRLKELLSMKNDLKFNVDDYIMEQESKNNIQLTDKQKSFFSNIQKHNVSLLIGNAGMGKSQLVAFLIDLLEELKITYKLLSPTGKASKVLSTYTDREVETIHRAIGMGEKKESKSKKMVEDEFVIIDETSMVDVQLLAALLKKCIHENVKMLFIGDDSQIVSVGSGSVLYDLIQSERVPVTKLDKVFRQKDMGILEVATNIREQKKFLDNDFWGIKKFGDNCTIASVPQDKIEGGYKYYYNELLKKYNPEDIMVLTPTKKSGLGTIEVNKSVQEIVNPKSDKKKEKEYGFDKVTFREGDLVLNTKNSYGILNINEEEVNIVNGDIGTIEKIDEDEKEVIIDFGFDKVPLPFAKLDQLLHAWCITKHKCVTKDTWIYTSDGIVQINELNNEANISEFKKIDSGVQVFNGSKLEKPLSFYNNGVDDIVKFTTQRGYGLKCTLEHGVDILDEDGKIRRIDAKDLKEGSFVLLSKNSNVYGDLINLPSSWQDRGKQDVRTIKYKRPKTMSKEFARFLGYMVADGTVCKNGIKFSKRYKNLTEDFQELVHYLFGYENKNIRLRSCGDYIFEVGSRDIKEFCQNIDGLQPHKKFVPDCIMKASKKYQCEFLKSVFEDGTVNIKKGKFDHIEMSMKEEKMAKQLQVMLLNMGIVSTLRTRSKKNSFLYVLYIYKKDAKVFANNIGFICNVKNENLSKVFDVTNEKNSAQYSIPYTAERINNIINKFNINKKEIKFLEKSLNNNRIILFTLNRFLNFLEKHNVSHDEDYKFLKYISSDNVYLDHVTSITKDREETYCLEMPETHKFIQNGIHAYNSQGSGSPAVIVIMDKAHKFQINMNLLYTAVTRCKAELVILTQAETLNFALRKVANKQRNTFLKEFLVGD